MKIIYLHQYYNTLNYSGSTRSFEFSKKLIEMGHEVVVVTSFRETFKNNIWFQTNDSQINIHWLPLQYSNRFTFLKRLKIFLLFAWKSYFKIKKIEADIIFASSTPLTIAIPAIFAAYKKNIPMIFEVRDLWPDIPIAMKILKNPILIFFSKLLEMWAYKYSNAIITLSPEMKDGIVKKKVDKKKIAIIPNSSDIEMFKSDEKLAKNFRYKRPWLKNRPLLVYTGAFGQVNDLSYLIRLSEELIKCNSQIKILLLGDGFEKEKLIATAKKSNVYKKNIFFENPVPKKDIPAIYSAANIISNIVVDVRENWANSANKFFDGLAAGKPIFLNHGGWMQDLVLKYGCGLCAYGKNIEEVAKELDLAINNKTWLKSSGEASKNLAKIYFDRKIHVLQLEKIFHLAINNKCKLTHEVTKDFLKK
jgi:glycosyltransferase involved in cell wall biosynthesis